VSDIYVLAAKGRPLEDWAASSPIPAPSSLARRLRGMSYPSCLMWTLWMKLFLENVLGAGCGMNVARQIAIGCGLPAAVPACTVNKVLRFGTQGNRIGRAGHLSRRSRHRSCGRTENMSRTSYLLPDARSGYRLGNGEVIDGILRDGLTDVFSGRHMGMLAELLAEQKPHRARRAGCFFPGQPAEMGEGSG